MECPSCKVSLAAGATECPSCGIILSRWRPHGERPLTLTKSPRPGSGPRTLIVVVAVIFIAGLLAFGFLRNRDKGELKKVRPRAEFDLAFEVPGSPQGIAIKGDEMIVGDRAEGVLRIKRKGDETYLVEKVSIIEPRYSQKINLYTITWNGLNYVGYTTASWFRQGSDEYVFTVHDPRTLKLVSHHDAPALLGCLAWDGTHYWAATRRHTADSPEPALLYRIDRRFKVISTSPSPGVGCQGLAFHKGQLWFLDVFSNSVHVIDVTGETPRLVMSEPTGIGYLSGIAFAEDSPWIVEYGQNRLYRVSRQAWKRAERKVPALASKVPTAEKTPEAVPIAKHRSAFAERKPDDTALIELSAELRDDAVWGSWTIWFGHELFVEREQPSPVVTLPRLARYEITTTDPDGNETVKEFQAVSGDNVMLDVRLTDAPKSGPYRVRVFMHAQFVGADGTARILNNSGASVEVRK